MLLSEIIAQNLVTLKYIYLLNFDKKKVISLIKKMLIKTPESRITIDEISESHWVTNKQKQLRSLS